MWVIVVYDISDDEKRNKIAKELQRLGLSRIQRSAFVGDLDSQRFKDLVRIMGKLVTGKDDILHIIPLGLRDWERRVVINGDSVRRETVSLL
ncbi:CRISPR-associated endonuclease Cas2 [Sulfurisphaera ohwakuensis]|uniref:CRISPR-associated endoribonuclease Cas2 n=1 Tax=Sulfurisphaera ohwakuensis TaxID=69656 RepID=A0A650CKF5_SULOH|nr:CRISPR-associated endonuclease Cas2 [Sulfurisphaera ohwakuensis]MBB5254781.1 CRISPR-associated protein Cas2 [Sulfurisphaera ohwakuensis]QGR18242.1 CRISPR-associated endonuclease Cas2 [Sulfurisphaera ohwakuensis]